MVTKNAAQAAPQAESAPVEEADPHGPLVASYGVRISVRQTEAMPVTSAPTLATLESLLEGTLAANHAGFHFTVEAERLDK